MKRLISVFLIVALSLAAYAVRQSDIKNAHRKEILIDRLNANMQDVRAIKGKYHEFETIIERLEQERMKATAQSQKDELDEKIFGVTNAFTRLKEKVAAMIDDNDSLIAKYGTIPNQQIFQRELDHITVDDFSLVEYRDIPNKAL